MRFWDFPASRDLEKPLRASASLSLWMNAGCGLGDPAARRWLRGSDQLSSTSAVEPAIGAGLDTGSCVLARLMTEAPRIVLHHCFTELDTHRVEATIEPENTASRALAAKLGFVLESGPLRDRLCADGQFRSVLMYGLLRPDWSRMVSSQTPGSCSASQ